MMPGPRLIPAPARGDRHVGLPLDVEIDHLADVHAVDVVGAEDRDDVRIGLAHEVQVLAHGVRGAPVPALAPLHLGGDGADELVAQHRAEPPGVRMCRQGLRLELGQHVERAMPELTKFDST
jgi:hypothetical protein